MRYTTNQFDFSDDYKQFHDQIKIGDFRSFIEVGINIFSRLASIFGVLWVNFAFQFFRIFTKRNYKLQTIFVIMYQKFLFFGQDIDFWFMNMSNFSHVFTY